MRRVPAENQRVLVVTPDAEAAESLSVLLRGVGHPVGTAATVGEALARLRDRDHDLIVADVELPAPGIEDLLKRVSSFPTSPPVVVLAGPQDVTGAVATLSLGAADYLSRPPNRDEVTARTSRLLEYREMDDRLTRLQDEIAKKGKLGGIVARSPAMKSLVERIRLLAGNPSSTVLILGESGAGKELVARTLHYGSPRRSGPFVPINCAAIAPNLIESELFGHERGAFTGAFSRRKGRFELAHGGTLFLDEVAETEPPTQAKLLRALEERGFMRVGGSRSVKVDVRLMAATNADLESFVEEGRFRLDLYYRLKVVTLTVPPLRQRREDIPVLAEHFVRKFCRTNGLPYRPLSREALEALLSHSWPGNVREMMNTLEAALVGTRGTELRLDDLPQNIRGRGGDDLAHDPARAGMTLEEMERELIRRTLIVEDGHRQRTASRLGIGERTLRRKIRTYGLSVPRSSRRNTVP